MWPGGVWPGGRDEANTLEVSTRGEKMAWVVSVVDRKGLYWDAVGCFPDTKTH